MFCLSIINKIKLFAPKLASESAFEDWNSAKVKEAPTTHQNKASQEFEFRIKGETFLLLLCLQFKSEFCSSLFVAANLDSKQRICIAWKRNKKQEGKKESFLFVFANLQTNNEALFRTNQRPKSRKQTANETRKLGFCFEARKLIWSAAKWKISNPNSNSS